MIDLHIHTTSSDGSDEPVEILKMAQLSGLSHISITDHDSIGAYEKLRKIKMADYFEGRIIPGCEFSVAHNGKPIEVLGYGIDLEAIHSSGIVSDEKFLERENGYLEKMKAVCRNLGLAYTEKLSISRSKYFASQVMHADLRKYPENEKHFTKEIWESVNAFYRTCINNEGSPFFLNQTKNYPTVQEAAKLIKQAGGKSFLAHLYVYFSDDYDALLNDIISLNALDGIECYHSLHSRERTDFLLNYCKEHKLYASGGSDYHGDFKPNVKLGEITNGAKIPFGILEPWLPMPAPVVI